MAITRADLVGWAQDVGATMVAGRVVFPDQESVIQFARFVKGRDVNEPPTVPNAEVDAWVAESGRLDELIRDNGNPIVRALARRLKQLGG